MLPAPVFQVNYGLVIYPLVSILTITTTIDNVIVKKS